MAARLERAAHMVAILRGLGYAGAYIGGNHNADRIRWIIQRSEEVAPRWEEFAEEISYAPKGGFYFFDQHAAAAEAAGLRFRVAMDTMAKLFAVKHEGPLRSVPDAAI